METWSWPAVYALCACLMPGRPILIHCGIDSLLNEIHFCVAAMLLLGAATDFRGCGSDTIRSDRFKAKSLG